PSALYGEACCPYATPPFPPSSLLVLPGGFFHALTQAEGTHIGPHVLDPGEALRLRTGLPRVLPTERVVALRRPDRVLLLVVHDHLVNRFVFLLVAVHSSPPATDPSQNRRRASDAPTRPARPRIRGRARALPAGSA